MEKFLLNPENGSRVIDQYGVLWIYDGRSKTWINMGFLDVYGNVSRDHNGLIYPRLFEMLELIDPDKFNCLRMADNLNASFYYFHSIDHTIKFKLEEHLGERKLRAEVEQSTLARKFREFRCRGPKGEQGDKGEKGISGIPASNEPVYQLDINKGLVEISVKVSTPLDTPVSLRLFRNQIQIGEFWVYQDGEVAMAFADGYSLKDGTTYNIYIEDNLLYAIFELTGDLTGAWTFKTRQIGPRGANGNNGNWFLLIKDAEIPEDLSSNNAIFEIGKSGTNISHSMSTVGDNICATGLVPADPNSFKFKLASTFLLSVKHTVSNCKNILRWGYGEPEAIGVPDLDMPQWTPTECCPPTAVFPPEPPTPPTPPVPPDPPPANEWYRNVAGVYTFIVPSGVNNLSIVAIGGGGGGGCCEYHAGHFGSGGGGGGGLVYVNQLEVTPGESLTVVVGAAASRIVSPYAGWTSGGGNGGLSQVYASDFQIVGYGGMGGAAVQWGGAGGSYLFDVNRIHAGGSGRAGGTGGQGGTVVPYLTGGGGGGAAGFEYNGGNGGLGGDLSGNGGNSGYGGIGGVGFSSWWMGAWVAGGASGGGTSIGGGAGGGVNGNSAGNQTNGNGPPLDCIGAGGGGCGAKGTYGAGAACSSGGPGCVRIIWPNHDFPAI